MSERLSPGPADRVTGSDRSVRHIRPVAPRSRPWVGAKYCICSRHPVNTPADTSTEADSRLSICMHDERGLAA